MNKSCGRKIAVVGLGYVGLPVAVAFGMKDTVIGFDVDSRKIDELKKKKDVTGEISAKELNYADIIFTTDDFKLRDADFIIVAVPTPVDKANRPDLNCLIRASEIVGKNLSKGSIVVYESTVYPGVTEEVCLPVLERASGLKGGCDFKVGYSPERINPGDREHVFTNVKKVVSGQDKESLNVISAVYGSVVTAGTYNAVSIRVAEAAKVIENTQRDLNLALMNELAILFGKMGIDTRDVLEAAGTKWNFLPFEPGLVGGHCIGVDPYYLTHKAEQIGYHPQVILAGRRINDLMGKYVAEQTIKKLIHSGKTVNRSKVLILGITFKENISDTRNSKVVDIVSELKEYGVDVVVYDPRADHDEVYEEYGIKLLRSLGTDSLVDAIIIAVRHREFTELKIDDLMKISKSPAIIMDVKCTIPSKDRFNRNLMYWNL